MRPQLLSTSHYNISGEQRDTISAVELVLKWDLGLEVILSREWGVAVYLGGQLLICMEIARSEFRNVREASWFHLILEADFLVLQDANPKLGSFFVTHSWRNLRLPRVGVWFLLLYQENCYLCVKWFPMQKASPGKKFIKSLHKATPSRCGFHLPIHSFIKYPFCFYLAPNSAKHWGYFSVDLYIKLPDEHF